MGPCEMCYTIQPGCPGDGMDTRGGFVLTTMAGANGNFHPLAEQWDITLRGHLHRNSWDLLFFTRSRAGGKATQAENKNLSPSHERN